MSIKDASRVFDSLTVKQHEALSLACSHLTSKQIAMAVGVAPVTIDKRIEAVRARLEHISRADLLRLYRQWLAANEACETYDQSIDDPIILGAQLSDMSSPQMQLEDHQLVFEDSIVLDARASWERDPVWLRPEMRLSSLGVSGKLAVMLVGAVAIMMIAVLCMAFVDALMSILER